MLGLLVQLALSWLLVWLYERNNLRVLGLRPTRKRLSDFLLFFFVTALCCTSGFLLKTAFSPLRWRLNPNLSAAFVLDGIWWNLKSVLFEELIFRGVLLYILLRRLGITKAVFNSAVAFGIYHWFSYGVFRQPVPMIFTFLITCTMGLVYALGYARTLSLYVPTAIHLGWNLVQNFIFSSGPHVQGIFLPLTDEQFRTNSYSAFLLAVLLPMLSAIVINYILLKRKQQVSLSQYKRTAFTSTI